MGGTEKNRWRATTILETQLRFCTTTPRMRKDGRELDYLAAYYDFPGSCLNDEDTQTYKHQVRLNMVRQSQQVLRGLSRLVKRRLGSLQMQYQTPNTLPGAFYHELCTTNFLSLSICTFSSLPCLS